MSVGARVLFTACSRPCAGEPTSLWDSVPVSLRELFTDRLARAEKQARKSPDLVKQNFTAPAPDVKWCGDLTEIPTGERTLYLVATEDLFSRRLLEFPGLAQIKTAIEKQEPDLANARRPYVSKIDRFGYF